MHNSDPNSLRRPLLEEKRGVAHHPCFDCSAPGTFRPDQRMTLCNRHYQHRSSSMSASAAAPSINDRGPVPEVRINMPYKALIEQTIAVVGKIIDMSVDMDVPQRLRPHSLMPRTDLAGPPLPSGYKSHGRCEYTWSHLYHRKQYCSQFGPYSYQYEMIVCDDCYYARLPKPPASINQATPKSNLNKKIPNNYYGATPAELQLFRPSRGYVRPGNPPTQAVDYQQRVHETNIDFIYQLTHVNPWSVEYLFSLILDSLDTITLHATARTSKAFSARLDNKLEQIFSNPRKLQAYKNAITTEMLRRLDPDRLSQKYPHMMARIPFFRYEDGDNENYLCVPGIPGGYPETIYDFFGETDLTNRQIFDAIYSAERNKIVEEFDDKIDCFNPKILGAAVAVCMGSMPLGYTPLVAILKPDNGFTLLAIVLLVDCLITLLGYLLYWEKQHSNKKAELKALHKATNELKRFLHITPPALTPPHLALIEQRRQAANRWLGDIEAQTVRLKPRAQTLFEDSLRNQTGAEPDPEMRAFFMSVRQTMQDALVEIRARPRHAEHKQ